jgi:hypothetical protein
MLHALLSHPRLHHVLRITARVIVLGMLTSLIASAPPFILMGARIEVDTAHPQLCVHTRLMDEVEEWKIQRTLQLVREMGAPTIVEFFPWAYLQPQPTAFDWSAADRIVRHAHNQGLRIIARLGLVPQWARPNPPDRQTTLNELPAAAYPAFAAFVSAFAERYHDDIAQLIIWNEPNLSFEWGYQPVNPQEYVRMLGIVYQAVKASTPDTQVLAAPLAPTLEARGSPAGLDDLLYLEDMYRAGLAEVSDGIAIHTYGFTRPPDDEPAPDRLNFRRAELHHAIMARYGDAEAPVYITEMGWNDHPRWAQAVAPSQRIAYTLDAFEIASRDWSWARTLCIWVIRFPAPVGSYPDDFTLVTPDFQIKPIYTALQAYARGWESGEPLWLPPPSAD